MIWILVAYKPISIHKNSYADTIFLDTPGQFLRAKYALMNIPPLRSRVSDVSAIKYTIQMLQDGVTVGMFPQGHRYNGVDPRTTKPKMGAAMISLRAEVPVLPVYIKVKNNRAKLFCRKDVYIGKPITPAEMNYNHENPGEYDRIIGELFERVCELGDKKA